ncbi:MAG: hypothetical protein D6740_02980 [Alphaproteobacteria bacterium]|nr:MAG: hypothetical protein D6740_02980 [Alphaproteobacteria bacterium]
MAAWLQDVATTLSAHSAALFLAIVALSLLQEDLATATAATMAAASPDRTALLFGAVCAGLLLGDNGLYAAGRLARRMPWLARRLLSERLIRLWRFLDRHGPRLVITARFLPGTRLVTYLACGYRPLAWPRFLLADLAAVFIWVTLIFAAARPAGDWLATLTGRGRLLLAAALIVILFLLPRLLAVLLRGVRKRWWPEAETRPRQAGGNEP